MPTEPTLKRVHAFVDGQNLFHSAKEAFGHQYPNYDPLKLAQAVCGQQGWQLDQVHFYTGVPDLSDNPTWYHFWTKKLAHLRRKGVTVFRRTLRYRNQTVRLPDGSDHTFLVGQEKGVDMRMGLDIVGAAIANVCDVALVFTQDQDFTEVADDVRLIAQSQRRWFRIASAFPYSPTTKNRRGIDRTDWIQIDRATYDACLDPRDYRQRRRRP